MIKHRIIIASLTSLLALTPALSSAEDNYNLTLINHFNKPLTFAGRQNAPEVLPELPATFTISANGQIKTKVVDTQKHAYMRVDDDSKHSAFFGVEVADNKVKVHGYLGKGIAYSWTTNVVTFCTPEDYQQKHKCE